MYMKCHYHYIMNNISVADEATDHLQDVKHLSLRITEGIFTETLTSSFKESLQFFRVYDGES